MSVQDQIGKLEKLLAAVQRNARAPREAPVEIAARVETTAESPVPALLEALQPPPEPVEAALPLEIEEVEELEMSETEIVEVAEAESDEILDTDLGEPIPESAPRAAVQTIEREIERERDIEREPPVKTPPPESGRQALAPAPGSPYAGAMEPGALKSPEIPVVLEPPAPRTPAPARPAPPVVAPPLPAPARPAPPPPAPAAPPPAAAASPVTVDRRAIADVPTAEIIAATPARAPETFLELLDAALRLGT